LSNCLDERQFLNTQCGSPAYAAPEIFAHEDYGPEVDIWSIGVNMYAMLAGKLPFKVENRSKNLAKLHACILKGFEMPQFLTPGIINFFFVSKFSCCLAAVAAVVAYTSILHKFTLFYY
jgi:serine/threonine protein kinase